MNIQNWFAKYADAPFVKYLMRDDEWSAIPLWFRVVIVTSVYGSAVYVLFAVGFLASVILGLL